MQMSQLWDTFVVSDRGQRGVLGGMIEAVTRRLVRRSGVKLDASLANDRTL